MHFVVLSSSRGTTFQAVIEAMERHELQARCLGLVTDRPDRGCIDKAKAAGLPYRIVEKREGESREEYDLRVHAAILDLGISFPAPALAPSGGGGSEGGEGLIACIGWMHILTPWFIDQYSARIINVHPSLLPKYGGKGMYGDRVHQSVLDAGEAESGITIHWMDKGVDTGEIIVQKKCSIVPSETVDSLKAKVQGLEKEWYPKVLQMLHTSSTT